MNTGNSILDRRVRNIIIGTVIATVVFGGALAFFLFSYLGKEEDAVKEKTAQFITAIEKNDPGDAPEGGDEFVTGINNAYGPIKTVTALDRRKISMGSGSQSHSYWVSEILVKGERGAAVVETSWRSSGFLKPTNQEISQVYELKPSRIHSSLSKADRKAVEVGYKARGSDAYDSFDLDPTFQGFEPERIGRTEPPPEVEPTPPANAEPSPTPAPAPEPDPSIEREQRKNKKRIKCVQRAKGDVEKLQKCGEI